MNRATSTVLVLLVVSLALPAITPVLHAAVPALLGLLVILGVLRLAVPPSRRRR
ncbi:MAG: hypothetical protein QOJ97_1959 [Solirubrobacteraceae bacterium]|jgi:hypothetical protein|nr:hypothetical protein [Solirubrobacteraceae bacterium]